MVPQPFPFHKHHTGKKDCQFLLNVSQFDGVNKEPLLKQKLIVAPLKELRNDHPRDTGSFLIIDNRSNELQRQYYLLKK